MNHRLTRILAHHHPDFGAAMSACANILKGPRAMHPEAVHIKALHRLLKHRSALLMFRHSHDAHDQAMEMRRRAREIMDKWDGKHGLVEEEIPV